MSRYKIGDTVVVLQSCDVRNIGRIGRVTDIQASGTGEDYYAIDAIPRCMYKEGAIRAAAGADLIGWERRRQIEVEGFDASHDEKESLDDLTAAAISYAMVDLNPHLAQAFWPESWDMKWFKPKDRGSNLRRSGALMAAALDKLHLMEQQRKEAAQ